MVRLVCDGPDHELPLASPGDLDLRWLHRTGAADDVDLLADAVSDLEFPPGRVHAFVHGEAEEIRGRSAATCSPSAASTGADMSCSPYWRRTMTDEAWRKVKRDFVAAMEADVA